MKIICKHFTNSYTHRLNIDTINLINKNKVIN